jgi:hypothetical protein
MTVSFEKWTQQRFSALNTPVVSQPQASFSSSEMVAERNMLWHRRSGYVHPPPSPVGGAEPSVTQDIIFPSSANPEAEHSLRLDFKKFIEVAGPGAYQVTDHSTDHSRIPSAYTYYSVGVFCGISRGFLCTQTRIRPKQTIHVRTSFSLTIR